MMATLAFNWLKKEQMLQQMVQQMLFKKGVLKDLAIFTETPALGSNFEVWGLRCLHIF